MITCDHCLRTVPVAPGHFNVSVPHVRLHEYGYGLFSAEWPSCTGNEKRTWRDALEHPAITLARQYAILDDDRYWEGL